MRVSTKLSLATVFGVALVISAYGYGRVREEAAVFANDMKRDHRTLAHGLALAAQTIADRSTIEQAVMLLEGANDRESRMQITWSAPSPDESPLPDEPISTIERDPEGEEEWLVTRVPLMLQSTQGVLQVRESLGPERAHLQALVWRMTGVMLQLAFACTVVIVGAGFVFLARPMRELLAKVRRVGAGDLSQPLVLRHRDEIGELATEINGMCERLAEAQRRAENEAQARVAAVEQMRHADRLSIVGRLSSGVAHELGTPLNVVLAHAHMIARRESMAEAAVADAQVIVDQTERMAATIRQLLDLARRQTPQRQSEDLVQLVRRTLALMEPVATRTGVALSVQGAERTVTADVDPAQIQQVIANLVMNGIQAQPQGGAVRVEVDHVRDQAVVRVADDGPGIPAETRERVFEPFYTTKEPGEGTGLGLTVSEGIVRDHGGRIEITSSNGRGSTLEVWLPLEPHHGDAAPSTAGSDGAA